MLQLFLLFLAFLTSSSSLGSPQGFQKNFLELMKQERIDPIFLLEDQGAAHSEEILDYSSYKRAWDAHHWRIATDTDFSAALPSRAEHRLTFLVFPGILGEFIPNKPFDDVAQQYASVRSPLVDAWKALDPLAFPCVHTSLALSGESDHLEETHSPLRELFTVFALPETKESPGADVVVLKAPLFSLETLGDMRALGPRYAMRVAKLWEALQYTPDHIVLIGYSLGVIPALDFVYASQAQEGAAPISHLISLSGILYGSAVADEALGYSSASTSIYREWVREVWSLHETLEPLEAQSSVGKKLATLARNQAAWSRFLADFARVSVTRSGELGQLGDLGKKLLSEMDQGKVLRGLGFTGSLLTEHGQWIRAYNRNIRRWRLFLEQALSAFDQLSTRGRQQWFESHEPLPSSLRFISVSAVMPSEVLDEPSRSRLTQAFNPRMLDFLFIRENLRMHQTLTKVQAMDAWVGIGESRYDPKVTCLLAQAWCAAEFPHEWWGVLNTDHWGIAIAKALPQKGVILHPFPRAVFLRAAAAALSQDSKEGEASAAP